MRRSADRQNLADISWLLYFFRKLQILFSYFYELFQQLGSQHTRNHASHFNNFLNFPFFFLACRSYHSLIIFLKTAVANCITYQIVITVFQNSPEFSGILRNSPEFSGILRTSSCCFGCNLCLCSRLNHAEIAWNRTDPLGEKNFEKKSARGEKLWKILKFSWPFLLPVARKICKILT